MISEISIVLLWLTTFASAVLSYLSFKSGFPRSLSIFWVFCTFVFIVGSLIRTLEYFGGVK